MLNRTHISEIVKILSCEDFSLIDDHRSGKPTYVDDDQIESYYHINVQEIT